MENLIAFIAGWLLSWPALIGLGIWCEHKDHRKSSITFALIILGAILLAAFRIFDLSLVSAGLIVLAYGACGVLWSFFRYRRFVRSSVEDWNEAHENYVKTSRAGVHLGGADSLEQLMNRLKPSSNTGKIIAWMVVWPFSFIENLAGDIIGGLTELVKTTFKTVYASIYAAAIQDLPAHDSLKQAEQAVQDAARANRESGR